MCGKCTAAAKCQGCLILNNDHTLNVTAKDCIAVQWQQPSDDLMHLLNKARIPSVLFFGSCVLSSLFHSGTCGARKCGTKQGRRENLSTGLLHDVHKIRSTGTRQHVALPSMQPRPAGQHTIQGLEISRLSDRAS